MTNYFELAISGIYAYSTNKKHLFVLTMIWVFIFAFFTIDYLLGIEISGIKLTNHFFIICFYSFTIGVLFSNLLNTKKVSANTIIGAVNTFILLGLLWAVFYSLIIHINPESFYIVENKIEVSTLLYFSFCTLTTLGHGDIIPLTSIAKSTVIIEAIIGVMYVAIIIPRFIGLYIGVLKKEIEKVEESI